MGIQANLYRYVMNSPLGFYDSYGLKDGPITIPQPDPITEPVTTPTTPKPIPGGGAVLNPLGIFCALLATTCSTADDEILPRPNNDPRCSPSATNPDCHWTGKTQEPLPGVEECIYECADGSTVYKLPGPNGCKDVVKKNDPYVPPGNK